MPCLVWPELRGWGGGYTGSSVLPLLQQVGRAHVELLDRWTVAWMILETRFVGSLWVSGSFGSTVIHVVDS